MGYWIYPLMASIWLGLGMVLWFGTNPDGSPLVGLPVGQPPINAAWFAFLLALWNAVRWYQFINQKNGFRK